MVWFSLQYSRLCFDLMHFFSVLLYRRRNTRHKNLNLSRNIVSLQVFVNVSCFSPCAINLSQNKNICCGLKKVVAKSRAGVYFEQQILALLLVLHQTHNFLLVPYKSTNQRAAFLQPATNVFVAGQVDQARWKTRNIDQNLQRNNVARQVEGFCASYFAAFTDWRSWTSLSPTQSQALSPLRKRLRAAHAEGG